MRRTVGAGAAGPAPGRGGLCRVSRGDDARAPAIPAGGRSEIEQAMEKVFNAPGTLGSVSSRPCARCKRPNPCIGGPLGMMGEELARCHAGAMLRARPGRYYCARCLARLLGTAAVWTKRDARRAIAVLFQWPIGLTAILRHGPAPCGDCGVVGGSAPGLGVAAQPRTTRTLVRGAVVDERDAGAGDAAARRRARRSRRRG